MKQTLAEYLAQGGRITRCEPARAGSGCIDREVGVDSLQITKRSREMAKVRRPQIKKREAR